MRRVGNLFNKWANYQSLLNAFYEVRKGKSYHNSLLKYERNLAVNLSNLLKKIQNGTYQPRPFREFKIYDPKTRVIQAPHLEDRIVQHAIINVIREPIHSRFIHQTFACIKGRGTHKANKVLQKYIQQIKGKGFYLKLDISKYFYSIDHTILMKKLNRIIKCTKTLEFIKIFITQGGGTVGIPIGSVLSQTFANLMLNDVDHYIKRELKRSWMVRYMDDIIILSRCKETLKSDLQKIVCHLDKIKLKINPKTSINRIENGIDFVGYRTWRRYIIIRKRTLYKAVRRIKQCPDNISRLLSYLAHAKRTKSLICLIRRILNNKPDLRPAIVGWRTKNK